MRKVSKLDGTIQNIVVERGLAAETEETRAETATSFLLSSEDPKTLKMSMLNCPFVADINFSGSITKMS